MSTTTTTTTTTTRDRGDRYGPIEWAQTQRRICLVLETAAFCDASVRSTVYKSSYLLTYLVGTQIIDEGGLNVSGRTMHTDCFRCTYCNTQLAHEQFTFSENKAFCSDCYKQIYAKTCHRCQKPITGSIFEFKFQFNA